MQYIYDGIRELETKAMMIDPSDSASLARIQGARQSLVKVLGLEESAHELNKVQTEDDTNER